LEVLQWVCQNSCPRYEDTCIEAAKGGHQEVLHWARLNGFPYNEDTCKAEVERFKRAVALGEQM
jgi:hypothetical protein